MIEANLRTISCKMWFRNWHEKEPHSYVKITLKVLHSFSHISIRLACPCHRDRLCVVRKAAPQGCTPSSLPLSWAATHLASQAYSSLQFCPFETHEHHWKGNQCNLVKMPVSSRTWYFRYKSLRLLLKRKFDFLIINYFMWRKRHCYNGSKPFLNTCEIQSSF